MAMIGSLTISSESNSKSSSIMPLNICAWHGGAIFWSCGASSTVVVVRGLPFIEEGSRSLAS